MMGTCTNKTSDGNKRAKKSRSKLIDSKASIKTKEARRYPTLGARAPTDFQFFARNENAANREENADNAQQQPLTFRRPRGTRSVEGAPTATEDTSQMLPTRQNHPRKPAHPRSAKPTASRQQVGIASLATVCVTRFPSHVPGIELSFLPMRT